MNPDTSLLMGEVIEDPNLQKKDVEKLITSFLMALVGEQSRNNALHHDRFKPKKPQEGSPHLLVPHSESETFASFDNVSSIVQESPCQKESTGTTLKKGEGEIS